MFIGEAVSSLLPEKDSHSIALTGAGGKTGIMFALAEYFSMQGKSVAVTTTTHIFDPRLEKDRFFESVEINPSFDDGYKPEKTPVVFASKELPENKKLKGVSCALVEEMGRYFDVVLNEADGARMLPVKAPGDNEPVIPENTDLVIGVVGLDCLGKTLNEKNVFRPEVFSKITGCNEKIEFSHLANLINHEKGLFKNTPSNAKKITVLNKTDVIDDMKEIEKAAEEITGTDMVLLLSLFKKEIKITGKRRM